jgi:KDO2-lipid IV(A) lauroyltransferase
MVPRRINIKLGEIFGYLMYYVFPLRKSVAKKNLNIAFRKKDNRYIKSLLLNTYKHYGILTFEFLQMYFKKVQFDNFIIDNETKKILSNKSGIILMTAHLGNWEMIPSIISQYKKVTGVVREQQNSGGNKFFSECRTIKNVSLIPNKGSKRKMLKALHDGEILLLATDQNAKHNGTYINFFGEKASIPKGAGHFYYSTKSVLVIGFCILNKNLKYEFKLREIKINNNIEQKEEMIVEVNSIYSKLLENEIIKYPEQYFWFHKKWDKNIYKL